MNKHTLRPTRTVIRNGILAALLAATAATGTRAQVFLTDTDGGGTYSQPFTTGVNGVSSNTMINNYNTSGYAWTDNTSIAGWYAVMNGARPDNYIASSSGNQNGSAIGLFLFRPSGTSAALGTIRNTNNTGFTAFGVHLVNNTGKTITALAISYIGQQWQVNTGSADELTFQYSTDATSLTTGDWTTHDALTVKSVEDHGTGNNVFVGSDLITTTYQRSYESSITGLSLAPGAGIWLRWVDVDVDGVDQALSIDNFALTPVFESAGNIPEPGTWAVFSGLILLVYAVIRRRD
ncbi:MAG: hypothetical protein LBK99_25395 [Opitutaceae bacterium]|jgi:hypothetical protein|nr:hypothetical protein [Opitutaceae bacterium]